MLCPSWNFHLALGYIEYRIKDARMMYFSFEIIMAQLSIQICSSFFLMHYIYLATVKFQAASIVSSSIQPLQNVPLVVSRMLLSFADSDDFSIALLSRFMFSSPIFGLQKYVEENITPNGKLPWAQYHIRKGFAGKVFLTQSSHMGIMNKFILLSNVD